jgi:hypothetical protein
VVKQVTKEDDDARVGCTAHKLEIFSDLLYWWKSIVENLIASTVHFCPRPVTS